MGRAALAALAASLVATAPSLASAAPPGEPLRTAGGEVTALRPAGTGWTCRAFGRSGDGFQLAEVTCRKGDGPDLLLYARDYAGPRETLDGLCGQDWAGYFKELVPALPKIATRRTTLSGRPTCAVDLRGLTAAGRPTRVLEWYAVVPGHVLVISAAGPAAAMDAATRLIDAWRDGVTFSAGPGGPAQQAR